MSDPARVPDTQNREPGDLTQNLTEPESGPADHTSRAPVEDRASDSTTHTGTTAGNGDDPKGENPIPAGPDLPQTAGADPADPAGQPPRLLAVRAREARTGSLTITPDQTTFTPEQKAAFGALGVDPADPIARAHLRRFLHVCQIWGVDPWAGEIYLVQRGRKWTKANGEVVDNRTWTIQTSIDGYRRRARDASSAPGAELRWIGSARWLWSGPDDDAASWRESIDPDTGDVIMRRVWWEAWPDVKGNPGMAKAVIRVQDVRTGEIRVEEFVAHWDMYAVWEVEYEGTGENRRKKIDPVTGQPVMKLGTFWERGKAHMLGKVAEAAVLRATFGGLFAGVRVADEMHHADADAATQIEDAVAAHRREAFAASQATPAGQPVAVGTVPLAEVLPAGPQPGQESQGEQDGQQDQKRKDTLLAEIDWIAELLEKDPDDMRGALARRSGAADVTELTADAIIGVVGPFRAAVVIPRLRADGRHTEADAYESFGVHTVAHPDVLTGRSLPPPAAGPHPFQPGPDDSVCAQCSGFEDDSQHAVAVVRPAA